MATSREMLKAERAVLAGIFSLLYKPYGFGFSGYRLLATGYRLERLLKVLMGA